MSDEHASPDFARMHGWDRDYHVYIPPEVPTYVGPLSFSKRPWVEDAAATHHETAKPQQWGKG